VAPDGKHAMPEPLYDAEQVETPEQIEISLPLAGAGTRATAYLIDFLCQLVPLSAVLIALFVLTKTQSSDIFVVGTDAEGQPHMSTLAKAIFSLTLFAMNFGYFAFLETLWRGQTPGKRAMGLRVMRDGGFPLDGRAALVRNLLRIVDFLPMFYAVGMTAIFLSSRGKRIGDYAAGTLVVREGRSLESPWTAARDGDTPWQPGSQLSPAERALVDEFLDRRRWIANEARVEQLARALASRLARRLGEPTPTNPETYLKGLRSRVS
jgi:uncharacterized RDD family membrane protein YckC